MGSDRLRTFRAMQYGDPRGFLLKLGELEPKIAASNLHVNVRTLRTNALKPWRESREAALFCHFLSERIGSSVLFARGEAQDYDFVATWEDDTIRKYAPIQLKEVVPAHLNPDAEIAGVIASLAKYTDSSELTVAIHLNKPSEFDPMHMKVPKLPLASLWVFGAISPDATRWGLWGDLLGTPVGTQHDYPAA